MAFIRPLIERVAHNMGMLVDDQFTSAFEGSCVTEMEYAGDESACHARIRGALEELDPDDGFDPDYDPLDDFNYVGSRHHY